VRSETRGHAARSTSGKLLGNDGVCEVVGSRTAHLGPELHPEEPELSDPAEDLLGEGLRALPFLGMRDKFALDEGPHLATEVVVLGVEEQRLGLGLHKPSMRPITSRMTSSVPPPIRMRRASRQARCMGNSIAYP
jgi:hypothetical protein